MQSQPEERDIVLQQYEECNEAFQNAVDDIKRAASEIESENEDPA